MRTADILNAIDALDAARQALRVGCTTTPEQMRIADACSAASAKLRHGVDREHPEVKLETA
jgi:hypothetical protein